MNEIRIDIREFAGDAAEERIASHTVGIVCTSGGLPQTGIGTGTAISYRGNHGILTARHVIETTAPEDLYFFFRKPGSMIRAELEDFGGPTALLPRVKIQIKNIHKSTSDDLALLEVSGGLPDKHNCRFTRFR